MKQPCNGKRKKKNIWGKRKGDKFCTLSNGHSTFHSAFHIDAGSLVLAQNAQPND